jgi:hypothetical protein
MGALCDETTPGSTRVVLIIDTLNYDEDTDYYPIPGDVYRCPRQQHALESPG